MKQIFTNVIMGALLVMLSGCMTPTSEQGNQPDSSHDHQH